MISFHSNRKPKTKVGTMNWCITVKGLTMLLFEGIWTRGPWIRKVLELCKFCLMGNLYRNMEDSGAGHDLNCKCLDQEFSVCGLGTHLVILWEECGCFLPLSEEYV